MGKKGGVVTVSRGDKRAAFSDAPNSLSPAAFEQLPASNSAIFRLLQAVQYGIKKKIYEFTQINFFYSTLCGDSRD